MELPKRKPNRLTAFSYNTPGAYFITVCTAQRGNVFWQDVGAIIDRPENVPLNQTGKIVDACIREIPKRYPAVSLDHYVVMPDHIHLIVRINADVNGRMVSAPTVSTVVGSMKRSITKQIGRSIWQKSFYEHGIRNQQDYDEIWEYIENNPLKYTQKRTP